MKVLIAILSCHAEDAADRDCRATWLKGAAADYRFFRGRGAKRAPLDDEVFLDAPDDYYGLPHKVQAIAGWALDAGYDFSFKCDNDTFVSVPRLLASGFEKHDYSGFYRGPGPSYASGGSGYWLSRRAMEIVRSAKFIDDFSDETRRSLRGEDVQVGGCLLSRGIECFRDERYSLRTPGPEPGNDVITLHDVVRPCRGARMHEAHRAYLGQ
jgi:hypothetical protein